MAVPADTRVPFGWVPAAPPQRSISSNGLGTTAGVNSLVIHWPARVAGLFAIAGRYRDRLLQPEGQYTLRREPDALAAFGAPGRATRSGAGNCPDGRAFSAARDGADDRTHRSAASNRFGCAL